MKAIGVCLLLLGCVAGTDRGDDRTGPPARSAVVWVDTLAAIAVAPGETRVVTVPITIADGYHVQANPAANEFLIPLELKLDTVPGVSTGPVVYPQASPFRLEGTTEDLMTYQGDFLVTFTLQAHATAARGEWVLGGTLRYQACDSRTCLFPATIPISIVVRTSAE